MARLHTKSDLARLAGVSPAAITKACKRALKPAVRGRRIDLDHPAVAEYLREKGVDPTATPPTAKAAKRKTTAPRPSAPNAPKKAARPDDGPTPDDLDGLENLTLEELLNRYGTAPAWSDWLDARKKLADTREKELRYEQLLGRLIEREFVRVHVFGALEALTRRLLGDAPKTIARRLVAMVRGGAEVEEVEAAVREIISSQLKPTKAAVARSIRNA